MKTVLLVPGFRQDLKTHDYKALLDTIETKGHKAVFVPILWKRTTIDDWVDQLKRVYKKHDPNETIMAGFSYGAMTVFA